MILGTLQISGSRQYSENEVNFHHLWIITTTWGANYLQHAVLQHTLGVTKKVISALKNLDRK